ncbi:MAG: hypothetical protein ACI3ZC_05610 [Candidatus Cryptobacteroides sp.]
MRAGKIISLTYQSFYHQEPSTFNVRPYCVKYFRSVPKHHSQKEIEPIDGWPAFTYHVAPTYDFKQELLSHGKYIEVLSPDLLRMNTFEVKVDVTIQQISENQNSRVSSLSRILVAHNDK